MIDFIFSSSFDWFIGGVVFTYASQFLGRTIDRAIERRKVRTVTVAAEDILPRDDYDRAVLETVEHNRDTIKRKLS